MPKRSPQPNFWVNLRDNAHRVFWSYPPVRLVLGVEAGGAQPKDFLLGPVERGHAVSQEGQVVLL